MKKTRGLGAYFLIILVVIRLWYIPTATRSSNVRYEDFSKAIKHGDVLSAEIHQNAEVPTGSVTYYLKGDGKNGQRYVI